MDLKIGSGLGIQRDLNGRYAIEARAFDGYNYSVVSRTEVEVTNEGANRRPTASLASNLDELYVNEKNSFYWKCIFR